jgi:hypothetical protein
MALVFQRKLAIPLWAVAFLTVALTAPPTATSFIMPRTTIFAILAVGIGAILFLMHGPLPWLRTSRAPARVLPSRDQEQANAAITMTAGTGMRRLDEPNRSAANDALDLHRMDDDGGWQMSRPPA